MIGIRIYFLIVIVAFISLQIGCKDKIVDPPVKNPREYTWTVDTIAYPGSFQTMMTDIWASSSNNVYIVGHNDQPGPGTMFRYDGKNWKTTKFHQAEGGQISGALSLWSIYGFGPNNIWAVGHRSDYNPNPPPDHLYNSLIIQYDGVRWKEHSVSEGNILQSIWGSSPTDIWAGGVNTLLHYNGVRWSIYPIEIPPQGIQFISISGLTASEVYMVGYRNDVVDPIDSLAYLMYLFNGKNWSIIDSMIWIGGPSPDKYGVILKNIAGVLYSAGWGVFKKQNSTWERLLSIDLSLSGVGGTHEQNIFAVGMLSHVWHYNGVDWYQYPQFIGNYRDFSDVWTDGRQVFIVGNDGYQTYVARGR